MLVLEPGLRIVFLSDLHLGDGTFTDQFGGKDRHLVDFLEYARTHSDAIVVIGDCFDVFQASSLDRIYDAHRTVVQKMREISRRHLLIFVRGNHEAGENPRDLVPLAISTDAVAMPGGILIEHGDKYDPFAGCRIVGRIHNFAERTLHSFLRTPLDSYDNSANRFIHRGIRGLVRIVPTVCALCRVVGWRRLARRLRTAANYWLCVFQGDLDNLFCRAYRKLSRCDEVNVLVCGHSHLPGEIRLGSKRYVNVGSWVLSNSQYCVWDGGDFRIFDWLSQREIRDEHYRPLMAHASAHADA